MPHPASSYDEGIKKCNYFVAVCIGESRFRRGSVAIRDERSQDYMSRYAGADAYPNADVLSLGDLT